jgi:hypothetical protein
VEHFVHDGTGSGTGATKAGSGGSMRAAIRYATAPIRRSARARRVRVIATHPRAAKALVDAHRFALAELVNRYVQIVEAVQHPHGRAGNSSCPSDANSRRSQQGLEVVGARYRVGLQLAELGSKGPFDVR